MNHVFFRIIAYFASAKLSGCEEFHGDKFVVYAQKSYEIVSKSSPQIALLESLDRAAADQFIGVIVQNQLLTRAGGELRLFKTDGQVSVVCLDDLAWMRRAIGPQLAEECLSVAKLLGNQHIHFTSGEGMVADLFTRAECNGVGFGVDACDIDRIARGNSSHGAVQLSR